MIADLHQEEGIVRQLFELGGQRTHLRYLFESRIVVINEAAPLENRMTSAKIMLKLRLAALLIIFTRRRPPFALHLLDLRSSLSAHLVVIFKVVH